MQCFFVVNSLVARFGTIVLVHRDLYQSLSSPGVSGKIIIVKEAAQKYWAEGQAALFYAQL